MVRIYSYEKTLIPEIPTITEDDNVIIATGQGKTPVLVLNDDHCEELTFPYLFLTGKFVYKVKREVPLIPVKYFNQWLLNVRQSFASDEDYIFLTSSFKISCLAASFKIFNDYPPVQSTRY